LDYTVPIVLGSIVLGVTTNEIRYHVTIESQIEEKMKLQLPHTNRTKLSKIRGKRAPIRLNSAGTDRRRDSESALQCSARACMNTP